MAGSKVHIAVIDDGINESRYSIGPLVNNIEINNALDIIARRDYDPYQDSHGTTCAAIIKKYCPEAELSSVRILNASARGQNAQLMKAIEWCVENDIDLINLSLGTVVYTDFADIKRVIHSACQKGIIIVAACNNLNIVTYPASLSGVIGVNRDYDNGFLKEGEYLYNRYAPDGIDITACGVHHLRLFNGEESCTSNANSFAAPLITSRAAAIMAERPGISPEALRQELCENAINSNAEEYFPYINRSIDWAGKSMGIGLGLRQDIFNMQVYPLKVELVSHEYLDKAQGIKGIKAYIEHNFDCLKAIDTIIVAINGSEMYYSEQDLEKLFKYIGACGKNIVFIDDSYYKNMKSPWSVDFKGINTKLWCPHFINPYYESYKKEAEIEAPLIAIYDFTGLRLTEVTSLLSEEFKSNGYNTIAAVDKPSGIIYDLEFVPMKKGSQKEPMYNPSVLNTLFSIYRPNLMILGIDAANRDSLYMKELEKHLELDIKIFIADSWDEDMEKLVSSNEDSKIIALMPSAAARDNSISQLHRLDCNAETMIQELAEYILELYENEQQD